MTVSDEVFMLVKKFRISLAFFRTVLYTGFICKTLRKS